MVWNAANPLLAHSFPRNEVDTIRVVFAAMGCLGLAGSIFVIFSYLVFPHLRSFNKMLVMCLAFADLVASSAAILSLGFFAHPEHSSSLCLAQAILIQYGELSSFIWSLVIAIHLYLCAVHNVEESKAKKLLPLYGFLGFVLPAIPIIVVGIENAFGNSMNGPHITWCWIKGDFPGYRIGFYYGPMATIWVICLVLYILISRKAFLAQSAAFKTVVVRLSLYILASVVSNSPALLNRVQNIISPNHPIFTLYLLHSIFNPLQGLMNAIVYMSSAPLRKAYSSCLKKLCCCCCSSSEKSSSGDWDEGDNVIDDEEEAYQQYIQTTYEGRNSFGPSFGDGRSSVSSGRGTFETEPLISHRFRDAIPRENMDGSASSFSDFGPDGLTNDWSQYSSPPGSVYFNASENQLKPTGIQ